MGDDGCKRQRRYLRRPVVDKCRRYQEWCRPVFYPKAIDKSDGSLCASITNEDDWWIGDPACGTVGFFLGAYDWMTENLELDKAQEEFLKYKTFSGNEIAAGTRRLALMNLFLHNIGNIDSDTMVSPNDSLIASPETRIDYVFANPPFGKKSSMTFTNEVGEQGKEDLTYNRQVFWVTTSNK